MTQSREERKRNLYKWNAIWQKGKGRKRHNQLSRESARRKRKKLKAKCKICGKKEKNMIKNTNLSLKQFDELTPTEKFLEQFPKYKEKILFCKTCKQLIGISKPTKFYFFKNVNGDDEMVKIMVSKTGHPYEGQIIKFTKNFFKELI